MNSEKSAQTRGQHPDGFSAESARLQHARLTEADAIELARQGDSMGFEQIYRTHCKRVYGLCIRMLANPSEAEDMTQEVFLKVFRKIHTFRADSLLSTWLHRVTFNAVLMHLRKRNPLAAYPQKLDLEDRADARFEHKSSLAPIPREGPLARLHLRRAVDKLPKRWRTVFLLHDVQGFKHEEIASIMRCSVNTSKGRLRRAHLQLRMLL